MPRCFWKSTLNSLITFIAAASMLLDLQIASGQPDLTISENSRKAAVAATIKRYELLNSAISKRDSSMLDSILAVSFTENGIVTRAHWISRIRNSAAIDSIKVLDPEFSIYPAVVKVDFVLQIKNPQDSKKKNFLTTDTWILSSGKLVLLIRLLNPLE